MLEIYQNALCTAKLYEKYESLAREKNLGACCVFCGIVRDEGGIEGLSFDIYLPLLQSWFERWQSRLQKNGAALCMAHSVGDVGIGESSFMCAILSSQRKVALGAYEEFIEDFKQNAPIWKYDLINKKRIYAKERSHALPQSGLLA
ncbi:molybdopterin converting factor, subunit 2 [Helicobacter mustelae]|uniref:molybdopterin synthase catalytic subunit n=1 Tax=Helicobacter mustelae TaxID=217 RepID=UPI000E042B5E|nr:molybdenum cofactor biosynthesis protein MoaE [Helicobacter mustelae]STP12575.1 molybdopterin converting factor, subunit 2 [Helicobacter mustelae]